MCIALLCLVTSVFFCWQYTGAEQGRVRAKFDMWRGRYVVLTYGLPPPGRDEYARLLRQRYGIELRPVAACIVSERLVSYVNAYDEVSCPAANRRFGHDVFKECEERALQQWNSSVSSRRTR